MCVFYLLRTLVRIFYNNNIGDQLGHFRPPPLPVAINLFISLEKTEIFSTPSLICAISQTKVDNFNGPIHAGAFLRENSIKTILAPKINTLNLLQKLELCLR